MTKELNTDYSADLELCRKVAAIMGNSSAASKALEKYEELRSQGKNPYIVSLQGSWRVYG